MTLDPIALDISEGRWWKSPNYEVGDDGRVYGCGAVEKFDPWEIPADDLLRLVLGVATANGEALKPATHALVGQVGLLGLGLLNVLEIAQQPVWELHVPPIADTNLLPFHRVFRRTTCSWTDIGTFDLLPRGSGPLGHVAIEKATHLRSRVLRVGADGGVVTSSFDGFVQRWMAAAPSSWRLACPLSAEFWTSYREPVSEIYEFCTRLLDALSAVDELRAMRALPNAYSATERRDVAQGAHDGLQFLRTVCDDARLVPKLVDGVLVDQWTCLTMAATIALRVLREAGPARLVRRCRACKQHFVTDEAEKRYCTTTCAARNRKRRNRGQKDAAPLHPTDLSKSQKVKAQQTKAKHKTSGKVW